MDKIIAIASGKGGVGKSTVAANLAACLANAETAPGGRALNVALIDVDCYGPSVPTLMGGGQIGVDHDEKFIPAKKFGVKYISMGFFLPSPDAPIIWRGPMLGKAITQLFRDVSWGAVDIGIVDLPPGTGDAQLTMAQEVKLDGAVMVTTPQEVALADVRRAVNMFAKVNVPVLGVVENMSGFLGQDGVYYNIFGEGGGRSLAEQYHLNFFGSVPIDISIREGGDKGTPSVLDPNSPSRGAFCEIASRLMNVLAEGASSPIAVEN